MICRGGEVIGWRIEIFSEASAFGDMDFPVQEAWRLWNIGV